MDPGIPRVLHWVECWTKVKDWLVSAQLQMDYYKPYLAVTDCMFDVERRTNIPKIYDRPVQDL
jgi:hypothetical protein